MKLHAEDLRRVRELRARFKEAANPEFAAFHKAYHKSTKKFYGLTTPPFMAILRAVFPARPALERARLLPLAKTLWASVRSTTRPRCTSSSPAWASARAGSHAARAAGGCPRSCARSSRLPESSVHESVRQGPITSLEFRHLGNDEYSFTAEALSMQSFAERTFL
jgi:hypothetical protein